MVDAFAVVPIVATLVITTGAGAQCGAAWLPGGAVPGTDGPVSATVSWAGRLVLGGEFSVAGSLRTDNIAAWDPATGAWSGFGSGADGEVRALVPMPGGGLVAAGSFTSVGGVPANRVAVWSGTAWSALGSGMDGPCWRGILRPSGDLVVAGSFATAGGVSAANISSWDGFVWADLGGGTDGWVDALANAPNGDLVIGGLFTTAGAVGAANVARWDGTAWSPLGAGTSGVVRALAVLPGGDIVAGGGFTGTDVLRWTGSSWTPVGYIDGQVDSLTVLASGELVAAGGFGLRRWNGTAWLPWGTLTGWSSNVTELPNGDVVAGGPGVRVDGGWANGVARWDGVNWSLLGAGTNDGVLAFARRPNRNLLAGGDFTMIEGVAAQRIAEWNGIAWSPLGGGTNGTVRAIAVLPNGDVVAGGTFDQAGGVNARRIARWNGAVWSAVGSDSLVWVSAGSGTFLLVLSVEALAVLPNGELIAGVRATTTPGAAVLRWDGTAWSLVGGGVSGAVYDLAVHPNGDLFAAGSLSVAGGTAVSGIARWDGASWSALGAGLGGPVPPVAYALVVRPDGSLVVGGQFLTAGGAAAPSIARWDGAAWSPLGTGMSLAVQALANLPDGDLVAGGDFSLAGGVPANRVARWDGASWSTFGSGLGQGGVQAISSDERGDVVLGGRFVLVDGVGVSARLARLASTCPAAAQLSGTGCSGGGVRLDVRDLPWLGSECSGFAAGLPANGLALAVWGLAPVAIPLSSLLPSALPGCSLRVLPDRLDLLAPVAGVVRTTLAIPAAPALVGQGLLHQLVVLELGTAGGIDSATASDAWSLTIGGF